MAYQRVGWENSPNTSTPLDADNLNHMEDGIVANEQAIEEISESVEGLSETVNDLSTEVEDKQDILTFDDVPTNNSNNPVKSNGIYDAILNVLPTDSAFGNPCVITDAFGGEAKSLKLTMNPIQDLHGYDKPWAGGGGKNKLPMTVTGIKAVNTSGTWSGNAYTLNNVTFTLNTDSDGNILSVKVNGTASVNTNFVLYPYVSGGIANGSYKMNGCPSGGATDGSTYYLGFYIPSRSVYNFGSGDTSITIDGTEGAGSNVFIHANAGYTCNNLMFYPMIRLSTESDSTFAPYTNICPISGRTEANVVKTGKNLFPLFTEETKNGITLSYSNGKLILDGTASSTAFFNINNLNIPSANYAISCNNPVTANVHLTMRKIGGTSDLFDIPLNAVNKTTTINSSIGSITMYVVSGTVLSNYEIGYQAEIGTTATDYEPYNVESITRTYGTTIYGGTDEVTGDGATSEWVGVDSSLWTQFNANNGYKAYRADGLSLPNTVDSGNVCNMISEYGSFSSGNMNKNIIQPPNSSGTAYMALDENVDVSTVQYFYKVATPTSIPLTAQNITLLHGDNVLTTDADSIEASYSADIALYIDKKIAEGVNSTRSVSKGGSSESTEEVKKEETPKESEEIKEEVKETKEEK